MNLNKIIVLSILALFVGLFVVNSSGDFFKEQIQLFAGTEGHAHDHGDHSHDHAHGDHDHGDHGAHKNPGVNGDKDSLALYWGLPFVGILLSIALLPLVMEKFWHHNYGKVALFWALLFAIPFYITYREQAMYEFLHIILLDYVPFIILLATLFTAAGGICLKGTLRGSPVVNTGLLALGTFLASVMGTTGAAMLLIRPLIKANKWRKKKVHLVVFFIFLVANIGGSLTPLGDPPLFLGFLKGVDFTWTFELFFPMLLLSSILLVVFFIFDSVMLKKEEAVPEDDGVKEPLRIEGKINFLFLAGIIGAIIFSSHMAKQDGFWDKVEAAKHDQTIADARVVKDQARDTLNAYIKAGNIDDTRLNELRVADQEAIATANAASYHRWHESTKGPHIGKVLIPWFNILRDGLLILIFFLSLKFTRKETREANFFTWEPILEVAKLFCAIFLTIIPVLAILKAGIHGHLADIIWMVLQENNEPRHAMYFWLTGILSSFLDNAPTYVVFFNTAGGDATSLMAERLTLLAISTGSVFMGANTYIGNAPNFMVKSIAEENDIKMPSFFGYMVWSVCILFPIFAIISYIWFPSGN
jgi:Na+/H+ antiporter NhaD/arsenite permease-like protein